MKFTLWKIVALLVVSLAVVAAEKSGNDMEPKPDNNKGNGVQMLQYMPDEPELLIDLAMQDPELLKVISGRLGHQRFANAKAAKQAEKKADREKIAAKSARKKAEKAARKAAKRQAAAEKAQKKAESNQQRKAEYAAKKAASKKAAEAKKKAAAEKKAARSQAKSLRRRA